MKSESNRADSHRSEMLWLAVRYASGELSAAESAAFEEQLAEDVVAADALSHAVILTESVAQAFAVQESSVPSRRQISRRWSLSRSAVVGASAATLTCVGWLLGWRTAQQDVEPVHSQPEVAATNPAAPDGKLGSMLSVWVSLNAADDAVRGMHEPLADEFGGEPFPTGSRTGDVPDWMFAALLPAMEAPSGMPDVMTPGVQPGKEGAL